MTQQAPLEIHNRDARRLWLGAQGLAKTPTGPLDLAQLIRNIGFVQLDSIRVVARAHDHIIWSRNQNYREPMLAKLLKKHRGVFEHFTHDASVIPIEYYPYWRRQFRRMEERTRQWHRRGGMLDERGCADILERIREEGPLCTKAFDTKVEGPKQMWSRPPHKLALDYMWYAGDLSTSHRENFTKFYDLTDRVIPHCHRQDEPAESEQVDWLCRKALDCLAFGSEGDIYRFWEAVDLAEVKDWVAGQRGLVPVRIECADKTWTSAWASADIEERLSATPAPTARLRILNPFDPVIRDRKRLERLFGFEYRIEIFVPAAKRQYGYYVFPLLEGDRFIGRVNVKADRTAGRLIVEELWVERKVAWTPTRADRLDAELARFARLAGVKSVVGADGHDLDITAITPRSQPTEI